MRPFSHHASFIDWLQHFTPNWFALNMGTGITALCLANVSDHFAFTYHLGYAMWLANIAFFVVFSASWLASMVCFPKTHADSLHTPSYALFLGCPPMALSTLINGLLVFGPDHLGPTAITLAHSLWWFDVVLSLGVAFLVPYYMFTSQEHSLATMTATWLLPFVACEVAAASGGLLMAYFNDGQGLAILLVSYALWGISLPLAFTILMIYFQRLAIHKLPPKEIAATMWLPLGPTATGALSLLHLNLGVKSWLSHMSQIDPSWWHFLNGIESVNVSGAWIMSGCATWWAVLALLFTCHYLHKGIPFNLSFWSFTFPLGVYTATITRLAQLTHWSVLSGYSKLLTFLLTTIWLGVFIRTLPGLYSGHFIYNPIAQKKPSS